MDLICTDRCLRGCRCRVGPTACMRFLWAHPVTNLIISRLASYVIKLICLARTLSMSVETGAASTSMKFLLFLRGDRRRVLVLDLESSMVSKNTPPCRRYTSAIGSSAHDQAFGRHLLSPVCIAISSFWYVDLATGRTGSCCRECAAVEEELGPAVAFVPVLLDGRCGVAVCVIPWGWNGSE